MDFTYGSAFTVDSPDAYETLILDALLGDASLFTRADEVEGAWAIVDPIIDAWADEPPPDFPNYEAGTWGPDAADELLAREGRTLAADMSASGRPSVREPPAGRRRRPVAPGRAASLRWRRARHSIEEIEQELARIWAQPNLDSSASTATRRRPPHRGADERDEPRRRRRAGPRSASACAATIQRLTGRHPSRTLDRPAGGPRRPVVARRPDPGATASAARGRARDLRRDDLPDLRRRDRPPPRRDRGAAAHPRPAGHRLVAGRAAVRPEPARDLLEMRRPARRRRLALARRRARRLRQLAGL